MELDESRVFFTIKGKEYCDENIALARLLMDDVIFCNERAFLELGGNKVGGQTTALFVICSDIFSWACADAECLPIEEIGNLYKMHIANLKWGRMRWCAIRRNLQPQKPVIKSMKDDGVWDEIMESLPDNTE